MGSLVISKKRHTKNLSQHPKNNKILTKTGVDTKVKERRRFGKFDKDKKVQDSPCFLNTEHEARLVLAISYKKRIEVKTENIFLMPMFSREDALKENLRLKKRKELINNSEPHDKIRNFKLINAGKKILLIDAKDKTD